MHFLQITGESNQGGNGRAPGKNEFLNRKSTWIQSWEVEPNTFV